MHSLHKRVATSRTSKSALALFTGWMSFQPLLAETTNPYCPQLEEAAFADSIANLELPFVDSETGLSAIAAAGTGVSIGPAGDITLIMPDAHSVRLHDLTFVPLGATSETTLSGVSVLPGGARIDTGAGTASAGAYTTALLPQVYPGIDLSYHLNPRKLTLSYQLSATADSSRIQLQVPAIDYVAHAAGNHKLYGQDPQTGATLFELTTNGARGFVERDGQLSLTGDLLESQTNQADRIDIAISFGHPSGVINTASADGGHYLVLQTADRANLIRLDARSQAESLYQVSDQIRALERNIYTGDVLLLGVERTSERNQEGSETGDGQVFVRRLNSSLQPLVTTTYGASTGSTDGHDLYFDQADGALYLVGSGQLPSVPSETAPLRFTTLYADQGNEQAGTYFLRRLDPLTLSEQVAVSFTHPQEQTEFSLTAIDGELLLLAGCFSDVAANATCEYEMSEIDGPYDTTWIVGDASTGIVEQWGHMALQWKSYYRDPLYQPENAFPPSGSITGPDLDAERLNQNEGNSNVFPNGDPRGGWGTFDSQTGQAAELAIGTALAFDWWSTPVFTSLKFDHERPAALQRVVIETTSSECMDQICDLEGWNNIDDGDWTTNDVDLVDADCNLNHSTQYDVVEVQTVHWESTFLGPTNHPGFAFASRYMPSRFEHVYDPPPGAEHISPLLAEVASRIGQRTFVRVPVITTIYVGTTPVQSVTGEMAIRMNDLQ